MVFLKTPFFGFRPDREAANSLVLSDDFSVFDP